MAYTVEEYTDMIITYGIAGENTRLATRLYAERYPKRDRHPTHRTIYNCVQRTRLTGNVLPSRDYGEIFIRDKFKESRILRAFEQNQGISRRGIARMLNTTSETVKRVLEHHEMYSDSESSTDEELPKRRAPSQRRKILEIKNLIKEKNNDCVQDLGSKRSKGTKGPEGNLNGLKTKNNNKESESHVLQIGKQELPIPDENQYTNIVLNATTEFCNTLVDTPIHETIGKIEDTPIHETIGKIEENEQQLMDFEFVAIKNTKDSSMFLDEFKSETITSEAAIEGAGSSYG